MILDDDHAHDHDDAVIIRIGCIITTSTTVTIAIITGTIISMNDFLFDFTG